MPRIRTNSSTPESRRRELHSLKSSTFTGKINDHINETNSVVGNCHEYDNKQHLFYAQQFTQSSDEYLSEYLTIIPPVLRACAVILSHDSEIKHSVHVSTIIPDHINTVLPIHQVTMSSNEKVDCEPHFVTCLNIKPHYDYSIYNARRSRTSSLPSTTIVLDLSMPKQANDRRCSSLNNLTLWQNNPQKIIPLFNRHYHCQPMSCLNQNKIILANSEHIDIYNIITGRCDEQIAFESSSIDYIAVCYNKYKNELLIASTSKLFVYHFEQRQVKYEIDLPGSPFALAHNNQIRYLVCNSSSIYHGYLSASLTRTSTVLSRLSQYEFKHVCDLEFDDGIMHGLHAFENYIGIVMRYSSSSLSNAEEYCLYVYDCSLDQQFYHIDLYDIGLITCLTGYERTLDWVLCDYKNQRILFVNQESTEFVQYTENINQCIMLNESDYFLVWLPNRLFAYKI